MTGEATGTGQAQTTDSGSGAAATSQGSQQQQGQAAAAGAAATTSQTTTTQQDGQQPAAQATQQQGQAKDDKGAQPQAAPEKYEAFKLPEGVSLDDATMGEFQTLAKDLGLSQDNAQKLVDLGAKLSQGESARVTETVKQAKAEWEAASKADKEFGGEKFAENLGKANEVFAKFGTPELKQLLIDSGLGNHPEVVRWAFRVSKALSEDRVVRGDRGASAANTTGDLEDRAAQKLYGKTGS